MVVNLMERYAGKLGEACGRGVVRAMVEEKRHADAKAEPPKVTSIDELGSVWTAEASVDWLIPDLLPEASVNLLCSRSGTGKTWLAYFLAGSVAHGSQVFGKIAKKHKVVYIDGENPLFVVKDRLFKLGIAETANLKVWGRWQADAPPGPNHPLILKYARSERPLLIWDSLVEFHTGDEQSSTETRAFMKQFRCLADLGATVLVLHHTGKADSAQEYRGSSDIEAAVDMAFLLKTEHEDRKILDRLTLDPFKCRILPLKKRRLEYHEGNGFRLSELPAEAQRPAVPDPLSVVVEIVRQNPGLKQCEIVERAKLHQISRNKVVAVLYAAPFRHEQGAGNTHHYFLEEHAAIPDQPVAEERAA